MQDGDHDALNFPVLGDPSAVPASLDPGSNKLLVAATLAALIIAGSAIVYRTIPLSSSRASSSSISGQDDAVHKQKKMKMTEPLQAAQKRPEREEGDLGANSYDARSDSRDPNGSLPVPASPTRPTEEFDSKESKSSRSKDRRRRGKDPIKEMLKSEKRSRGLGAASPTLSNRDYTTFIKSPAAKEDPSPSSPSTSLFTDSQLTRLNDSGKNAKSKRTGQREKSSIIGPDDTTSDRSQQARGNSLGTISGMHSRATSESISASESTHRQILLDRLEPPPSQVLPNDYPSTSDPTSSLASDDGLGRPHSSMSASTTSSAGSRHVGNLDDQDDVLEWETIRREKPNKMRRASLSQARPGLASEDEDTRPHHNPVVAVVDSASSSVSNSSVHQPMKSASHPTSSVSALTETTTTTDPASLTSTAFISSGGISLATSPSLSHDTGDQSEARDKSGTTLPVASSSASVDTAKSPSKIDRSRKGSHQTGSSSVVSSDAHDPWDWDGAGNVPSSSSPSNIGEGDRNLAKDKYADKGQTKERDPHQKPPRLQQGGGSAGKAPSFSSVAASRLPASSTHPTSLYSPTSSSFGQSSGSGISASLSAAPAHGGSANAMSPSSGSDSLYALGEVKERDEEEEEEEAFTFPTLNPTTAVAGSSRTRSSLVDNNINNNNINSNTTHYNSPSTSRRAPTPRRPPTPARSNGTPPPHPSSSSPHPHGSSSSLNSPTSHQGSANGSSMPALSTQTQLASLRGALEAARLREEKNKQEMETYTKEMDNLRWENANWRRAQQDLQMQVRHLTHQLQSYASLVASVSPQLQQQTNGTGPSANPAASGTTPPPSTAPNGYGSGPSGSASVPATPQLSSASASGPSTQPPPPQAQQTPVTHPTPPPLHMQQMLSNLQMNGLSSPVGVLSPLSMTTPSLLMGMPPGASPSGFYPYPMPPHPPPHPYMIHAQQVQYMQQQYQQQQQQHGSAQPSPHQANVFSSIFPPGPVPPPLMSPHQQHQYSAYVASQQAAAAAAAAAAAGSTSAVPIPIPYGSRSSSVAGTSSAGSMSPDINGSPSPGGGGGGMNGNRRVRTRTLTANDGRPGAWEDAPAGAGEGWMGADDDGQDDSVEGGEGGNQAGGGGREDEYGEGEFNEVLADAILKRPGSIRVRSASRRGKLSSEKEAGVGGDNEEDINSQSTSAAVVVAAKEKVEVVEQLTEFTFPSLSNIGNVIYRSDLVAVNGGLSSSSSSSASPAPPLALDDVVSDVDPAGMDVLQAADPGPSESHAGLVESIPGLVSSVMTEETTPREDLLVEPQVPTKLTEDLSEDEPRQSREDAERTNSSSVEH